jgi:hypothetical protein
VLKNAEFPLNIPEGVLPMSRPRASWETRLAIWLRCALDDTDQNIKIFLELNKDKYPDAPYSRDTIAKVREEFSSLSPQSVERAIREVPELKTLVTDSQILRLMEDVFDRTAFTTPFQHESSDNFKQAITDTIKALNTGIRSTTDGAEIGRIPTRHQLKDPVARNTLAVIVETLELLRAKYDSYVKNGEIQIRGSYPPKSSKKAASDMDNLRLRILTDFRQIYPSFRVKFSTLKLTRKNQ